MLLICNIGIGNFYCSNCNIMFAIISWNEICCDTWKTQLSPLTIISFFNSDDLFIHPYIIKIALFSCSQKTVSELTSLNFQYSEIIYFRQH